MNKIIISNRSFEFNVGCRLLRLMYKEPFEGLEDIWDDIEPMTFKEIVEIKNVEDRRVAIECFGLERIHKELDSELVDTQTIKKKTTWVLEDGELTTLEYDDTYRLYKVKGDLFNNEQDHNYQKFNDVYYVTFKDTSTEREYLLWVNSDRVYDTNHPWDSDNYVYVSRDDRKIDAIEAIAWTITTNVKKGDIEEIIRQGDCILIKPKLNYETLPRFRHLTKEEYLSLITNES